jgi:hypothetical protein
VSALDASCPFGLFSSFSCTPNRRAKFAFAAEKARVVRMDGVSPHAAGRATGMHPHRLLSFIAAIIHCVNCATVASQGCYKARSMFRCASHK